MSADSACTVRFEGLGEFPATIGDSLLDVALRNEVALDHACGGVCACSTCHVRVPTGADALSEASEEEEDRLDSARDLGLDSRLGCQARIVRLPRGGLIVARIPTWNVNLVREGG
ncbi:MAG: 2Fe-2S iron-sulfur cluster-binding protein [Planctomycetota bacterium]